MVVLHFKKGDANTFLYDTNTSITIDQLTIELVDGKFLFPFLLITVINYSL